MCKICGKIICPGNCPNAPDPKTDLKCTRCGYPFEIGDKAYKVENDNAICEECMSDFSFIVGEII